MRNRSRRLLNAHFRSPNRLAADLVCEAFCRSIGADREHEDDAVKNCSGKHMLIGKQTAVRFVSNTVATCITRRSGGRPARSSDLTRGEQRDNQSQTEQVIYTTPTRPVRVALLASGEHVTSLLKRPAFLLISLQPQANCRCRCVIDPTLYSSLHLTP